MDDESLLREKYRLLWPHLDERSKRLIVAADAAILGYGKITLVARASGVSRPTIRKGMSELLGEQDLPMGRVRRPGGGRHLLEVIDPDVVPALRALVKTSTRGDPLSPLLWTTKSCAHLSG